MSYINLRLFVSFALSFLCNADFVSSSQTVILVDDSSVCTKVAKMQISALGYEVQTAVNGEQGLELARQTARDNPHLILVTDINMPVMDGLTLVRAIRADAVLKSIPIICMSDKTHELQAKQAGANSFVSKPFNNNSFKGCLDEFAPTKNKDVVHKNQKPPTVIGGSRTLIN